jgi:EAL domain-containing protein (putative c-di-GMP-specific phosphodiesterase class I)
MGDKSDQIKKQRDMFLAFSFASADLFLEVSDGDIVDFALGAARSLTGINEKKLIGQNWLDVFSQADRPTIVTMRKQAQEGRRCGPFMVKLDENLGGGLQAIVTGIKMPGSNSFYMTLGFTNVLMAKVAEKVREVKEAELLDKDTFLSAAQEALDLARSLGQDIDMTLLDIEDIGKAKSRLGDEIWGKFEQTITEFLSSKSLDGHTAAEIKEGRYSVIHDKSIDSDYLKEQLTTLAKEVDPEGEGLEVKSKTVSADLQSLSEREATKALIYTINEFERKGTSLSIETLNSGFKTYVSANAQKISQFKSMIERLSFDLNFQPIVDLETLECSHYEMLTRFHGEGSTEEWIIFGEDIGMAADFDIAVCERAINYLLYKGAGRRTKFAVNLSGQSIQNEQFFKTLYAKLNMNKELSSRLMFEITESTEIDNLEMVNHYIQTLQQEGFKVCLDDFGAGAASFKYIQRLHVDYVKIDGQYTRRVIESERDRVMIKNLAQMCSDLDIKVVAEKIENQMQADEMKKIGVTYGQGYLFAKPSDRPEYSPSLNAAE